MGDLIEFPPSKTGFIPEDASIPTGSYYRFAQLGDFYCLVHDIGDLVDDRGPLARIFSTGWLRTEFKYGDLSAVLQEFANNMPFDDYLNSMDVWFRNRLVYRANVNRYDAGIQRIHVFSREPEWQRSVLELLASYA